MYHIKNDRRAQTSAMLIAAGMDRLLERKSFEEITITDIQLEAGVGRATFYRLFDRKEDVLRYQCDRILTNLIKRYDHMKGQDKVDWLQVALEEWTGHRHLLHIIVEQNREDILIDSHIRMEAELCRLFSVGKLAEIERRQFVVILASMLIGTLTVWVDDGGEKSAAWLADCARKNYFSLVPLFQK